MIYLFFDLEYASSLNDEIKICEFGYVLTDEKFNLLERKNLIINPNLRRKDWDRYAVKKILTKSISEYECYPYFPNYYELISKLIKKVDLVFGHTFNGDVKAINDECKRYDLPSINFDFYDLKLMYKDYKEAVNGMSVTNILKDLNVEYEETIHNAETDAYNTMLILKELCNVTKLTVKGLIDKYPLCYDNNRNFIIKSFDDLENKRISEFKRSILNLDSNDLKPFGENRKRFNEYVDNLKLIKKESNILAGKVCNISINFTEHNFRQTINLLNIIAKNGGKFDLNLDNTNLFISYTTKEEKTEPAGKYLKKLNEDREKVEIIKLDDFLKLFNLSLEELNNMPMPLFDFLFTEEAIISDKKTKKIIDKIKLMNVQNTDGGFTISELNSNK